MSETEEHLRDDLARAARAGLDAKLTEAAVDWWPDTEAWGYALADRLRPVVHAHLALLLADVAEAHLHAPATANDLLRWAADERAKVDR